MVRITMSELKPAGSSLFSEAESFIDSIEDLTAEELSATKGGGSKFKFKKSRFGFFPGFGGFGGGFGGGITIINNNNNNNNGGGFIPSQPSPPPVSNPRHPYY